MGARNRHRSARRLALGASLAGWLCLPATADVTLPEDLSDLLTGDAMMSAELIAQEKARNAALRDALIGEGATGIRQQYRNRQLVEVSPQTAAIKALEKNLRIQRSGLGAEAANAALIEAEALFDPILSFSARYDESQTFDRVNGIVDKVKAGTIAVDTDGDGIADDFRVLLQGGLIDFIGFDKPRPAGLYPTTEVASRSDLTGPDTGVTYNISLLQQLSWGANFRLDFAMEDKEHFFVNQADARDAGIATIGSFGLPWIASIAGTYTTPLPYFGANWGENSDTTFQLNLAEVNRNRALDFVDATINDTLRDVDLAYYDLTFAVLNLEITLANMRQVEHLLAKTSKMFDLQEITIRGKAQVEAELERVKGEVEQSWNLFITRSNQLNELLDEDENHVFVPIGYSSTFARELVVDAGELEAADNPTYEVALQDLHSAELVNHKAAGDAQPNIVVDLALGASQNGSVYGHDFSSALINVLEPDRVFIDGGVNLNRPWGNRAREANKAAAELGYQAAELATAQTLNLISRELDDALVDFDTARASIEITQRNLALARTRYEKALAGQGRRSVTEFEIVEQSRSLLDANRSFLEALVGDGGERLNRAPSGLAVGLKQAEARLLAAAGKLSAAYGERTALNEIDRKRIEFLVAQHEFQYFGEEP